MKDNHTKHSSIQHYRICIKPEDRMHINWGAYLIKMRHEFGLLIRNMCKHGDEL